MSGSPLLNAALAHLARGWSIIPIADDKKPLVGWKRFQSGRATPDDLRGWLGSEPARGIAVVLGDVSGGIVCRDFDQRDAYNQWVAAQPDLAATLPTAQTARDVHVYAIAADRTPRTFSDGEYRGNGQYVILPPSIHPSGAAYEWINPPGDSVPTIDPVAAGFLPTSVPVTENTEKTEQSEHSQHMTSVYSVNRASQLPWASEVEAAARATLPQESGKRNLRVFAFARALKGMPAYADAPVHCFRDILRRWHAMALPRIGTKPFEETWIDFAKAWPKVKFPSGAGPVDEVFKRAESEPMPVVAAKYDDPGVRRLVRPCHELQRTAGTGPFYLACRTAGSLLGVSHETASRWLWLLVLDGVLAEVEKGGQAHNPRKASRYRWVGDACSSRSSVVECPHADGDGATAGGA